MKHVVAEIINEKWVKEEIEAERQKIGEPRQKVIDICFNSDSAMEMETEMRTATQKEEFDYLFHTSTAKPLFNKIYVANDNEKVRFYTGLPAYDFLQNILQYVSKFVVRKSPTLSQFQDFVLTPMRLKLNMPMQDLAYHFGISRATVSRAFSARMVIFAARLAPLIRWPKHEGLWRTMPQCFQLSCFWQQNYSNHRLF